MIQTDAVETAIMSQFGLVPREGWREALNRAAIDLGSQTHHSPEALLARAVCDPTLLKRLVAGVTIPESYFFRHQEQLTYLTSHIQSCGFGNAIGGGVSIWSAGCSRGEESYSLAILLKETLPPEQLRSVTLFGNDINGNIIAAAKNGIYSDWHFRGLSDSRRQMYFKKLAQGQYQLRLDIREMVSFFHRSIQEQLAETTSESLDVILFRNVGIYLSDTCLESLYQGFNRVLKPGGILCVAPSDPLPDHSGFQHLSFEHGTFYQKRPVPVDSSVFEMPTVTTRTYARVVDPMEVQYQVTPQPSTSRSASPLPAPPILELMPDDTLDAGDIQSWIARGQAALDASDPKGAETIFRQVLFAHPVEPTARFWYALSLFESKAFNRCRAQLNALIASLKEIPPLEILLDGESTAQELLGNAQALLSKIDTSPGESHGTISH